MCAMLLLAAACSKMDHTFAPIIKDGEIVYTGKADSAQAHPGNGRVALSWLLLSDPKITYCMVFWDDGKDSVRVPVQRTASIDTIRIVIGDLPEGTYTFFIYTGDDKGHSSVATQIRAHVYGAQYAASLSARPVETARWTDGDTRIIWQHASGGLAGVQLSYTDTADEKQSLFIAAGEDTTEIADLKEGSSLSYRTLYLPDSAAIDTFYTGEATLTPVFESMLDKSAFKEYDLPGDAVSGYGWVMSRLWDGKTAEPYGFYAAAGTGAASPYRYSFDLGQVVQLTRFRIWQRGVTTKPSYLYAGDNLKEWEVWGSTAPAADGSYDGWTKLMTCISVKPSGAGAVTDADRAYAAAGEEFVFPDTIPPVRYIRITLLSTWGGRIANSNTMEMTFWQRLP